MALRLIELFAGIGSQTQALTNIGVDHEVVAISEIDKYAIQSYEALHGKANNLGDISKIEELPEADLWTYSFPCQDISLAGKQAGIKEGTRSGLLWEVERLLSVAQEKGTLPKYLLLENVKNLVSKKFMPDFNKWLDFLSSLGYTNHWSVLNAKDYGIPQNRERVFCVSILGGGLFTFPEKQELKLKLKDMLEKEVDEKYYLSNKLIKCFTADGSEKYVRREKFRPHEKNDKYAYLITTCADNRPTDNFIIENYGMKQVGQMYPNSGNPQAGRIYDSNGISPTMDTCQGGNRMPKVLISEHYGNKALNETLEANKVEDGDFIDAYNRLVKKDIAGTITTRVSDSNLTFIAENFVVGGLQKHQTPRTDGISPTLTEAMGKGGGQTPIIVDTTMFTNNMRIRKLTPRECFRLMGWKDDQIDKIQASGVSNAQQYRQAGNGIVVQVLEAIFKALFLK